jgi:hypothetical protein
MVRSGTLRFKLGEASDELPRLRYYAFKQGIDSETDEPASRCAAAIGSAPSARASLRPSRSRARLQEARKRALGDALTVVERNHHLPSSRRAAFQTRDGSTRDEKGVRHALQFGDASIAEADALFMLGACASFVSYLLARRAAS